MPRYVLGLNKYDHDVAAVLLADGRPVVGIAKERITRRKNDGGIPDAAVGYCLRTAGIALTDIDVLVQNSYALDVAEMEHDLLSRPHALHLPGEERKMALGSLLFRNTRAATVSHHLAHAYSAFAASPFDDGAVMIIDGVGSHRRDAMDVPPGSPPGHASDRESESYYTFSGTELTPLHKEWLPAAPGVLSEEFTRLPGLGATYSRVAEYVFDNWNRCGEVMGLAAYGRARDDLPPLMGVRDGRTWAETRWPEFLCHPYAPSPDAKTTPGERNRKWEESPHAKEWRDLTFRVQTDLEESLLERAHWLHEKTGAKHLVCAGGVMLNCVANTRLLEETPFESVWVQPAAGDTGIALGCALYGDITLSENPRRYVMGTDGFGRQYSGDDIDEALAVMPIAAFLRVREVSDVAAETAKLLADSQVIGWFQGGAELGPRALGQRSLLCDPRDPHAKERLNARVKHRQAFRPFAPAVPIERADDWFEPGPDSTHMLFVRRVREDKRDQIPAVVHVDGTARLQTVVAEQRPELHALLEAFGALTGVPVLVNTSFNVKGEPIVETPLDAVLCFMRTDIDALVLGDRIVTKRWMGGRLGKWLVATHTRSGTLDPAHPPGSTGG